MQQLFVQRNVKKVIKIKLMLPSLVGFAHCRYNCPTADMVLRNCVMILSPLQMRGIGYVAMTPFTDPRFRRLTAFTTVMRI
jgi:hypothetical protein